MDLRPNWLRRAVLPAGLALAALLLAPAADARVVVGVGIGVPLFFPPPVVYAPPPAYYYPPPPVAYSPPPAYYPPQAAPAYYPPPAAPAAAPSAPASAAGQQCRQYQSTSTIDGAPQTTVGTACLQPDGTWRIVN